MKRRAFIASVGLSAMWPLTARGQSAEPVRRLGILTAGGDQEHVSALRAELALLGWIEGKTLRTEERVAREGTAYEKLAAELLALDPEVLVANPSLAVAALHHATKMTPIVFVAISDPVDQGFVASLAHPAGNVTGFVNFDFTIASKWLEILKEIASPTRLLLLTTPASLPGWVRTVKEFAPSTGMTVEEQRVAGTADIDRAIGTFAKEPGGCLVVHPGAFNAVQGRQVIALAALNRIPAMYPNRPFAADGGLASYGIDRSDLHRRAAAYVDRILRGAYPGDLPVQNPTKFEFVINLKTARALGLTLPPSLLARADEVIE